MTNMLCSLGFHSDRTYGKSAIQLKILEKIKFDNSIAIVDNCNIGSIVQLLKWNKLNIPAVELYITESYEEKRYPREIIRFYAFNEEAYKSMCQMVSIAGLHKHYSPRVQINDLVLNGDFIIIVDQDFLFLDKLPKDKTYIAINADTDITDSKLLQNNTIFYYDSYAIEQNDLTKIEVLSARAFKHSKRVWYKDESHFKIASFFPESIDNYNKIVTKVKEQVIKFDDKYPIFCDNAEELFNALVDSGFKRKCPQTEEYKSRIDYEKSIINKLNYQNYFLINWDFINYARSKNIPIGPGRGSVAGSLIAYCLDISKVDPIKYNLYFERFLNVERVSPPDIDTDVARDDRQFIIEYIKQKYEIENVSQIITYNQTKAKMAFKDSCRLHNIPAEESNRITSYFPPSKFGISPTLEECYSVDIVKQWALEHNQVWEDTKILENFIRHTAVHAAGVVISPKPLSELVGLSYSDKSNEPLSQLDRFDIEKFGLLKLDLLGLETLGLIKNTCELIGKSYYDLELIPMDDIKVFEAFTAGQTLGIFQMESDGMTTLLKRIKPTSLEDISAANALYRPGPLSAGLTEHYVKNKNSICPEYFLEDFKDLLSKTYGVIVYQEDVMLISQRLAGFSLSRADNLRKAIGKKNRDLMDTMSREFTQGCVKNGHKLEKANKLWEIIVGFADYAFNKSHSMAYGILAYQTMYLKVHHPREFAISLLSSHANDTARIRADFFALKDKIKFLKPSINQAKDTFTLSPDGVMIGFSAIKGLGNSAKTLVENQPYSNIIDVGLKNKLDSAQLTSLIFSGALDEFEFNKGVLLGNVDRILKYSKANNASEIFNIFDPSEAFALNRNKEFRCPTEEFMEKTSYGFSIYYGFLSKNTWFINRLPSTTVIGTITEIKRTKTRKHQEDMAILTVETSTNIMKIVLFPKIYDRFNIQLAKEQTYAFKGEFKSSSYKDEEEPSLLVNDLLPEAQICIIDAHLITKKEIDLKEFKEKINKIKFKKGICQITLFSSGLDDELFKLYFHEDPVCYDEEIHNIFLEMGFDDIQLHVF